MAKQIKIASWNIAGAHAINTLEQFDYQPEDISYFANQLKEVDADIICLQETHLNQNRSIAKEMAGILGFSYVYDADVSPSHIDENYRLGNAIISRYPLKHIKDVIYPYPDFELRFPSGKLAKSRHDKMVQIYEFDSLMICNTQMLPLELFGYSYTDGLGKILASKIEKLLLENINNPVIFCGDFNFDTPEVAYPEFVNLLQLNDALPAGFTRPDLQDRSVKPDHIFISSEIDCHEAKIIEVNADHYLCYSKLSY